MASAQVRVRAACGPSAPAASSGRPTTSSSTVRASTIGAQRRRVGVERPRAGSSPAVAPPIRRRRPRARPIRRSPRSIPSRRVMASAEPDGAATSLDRDRPRLDGQVDPALEARDRSGPIGRDGDLASPNGARIAFASSTACPGRAPRARSGSRTATCSAEAVTGKLTRLPDDDRVADVDLGRAGNELVVGLDGGRDLRLGDGRDRRGVDRHDRPGRGQAEGEGRDLLADERLGRDGRGGRSRACRSPGRPSRRRPTGRDPPSPPGTPPGARR